MYDFIPAEEKHLDQIVPLLMTTGYYEMGLKNNLCNMSSHDFMSKFIAKPYLSFTTVAVKRSDHNSVIGVIVYGSKIDINSIPTHINSMDPKVATYFENFSTHEISEGYHISFLAVSKAYRGQGIAQELMRLAEEKSKKAGYDTISLYTFGCQTSSIKFYIKMGMMPVDSFILSKELKFPLVLYFEKSTQLVQLSDYFETEEYRKMIGDYETP